MQQQQQQRRVRWGRGAGIALGGVLVTYVVEEFLTNNPLTYSPLAQAEFMLLGAAISIAAAVVVVRGEQQRANPPTASAPDARRQRRDLRQWLRSYLASIPLAAILVAVVLVLGPFNTREPRGLEWLLIAGGIALTATLLTLVDAVGRLRAQFGGLSWRLSASYFVVTLIAAAFVAYMAYAQPNGISGHVPLMTLVLEWLRPTRNASVYFVLVATATGTATGVLFARHLTARLGGITRAAERWAGGDFSARVRDSSRDELGQLGRDLDHMAEQLQSLLASREALAVVEERNRLARELHDSVKQQVFAGALLVRAARTVLDRDPAQARAHLDDAEALAGRTQDELIALIRALRPAALADRGLAAELSAYAAEWSGRTGIAQTLSVSGERATPLETEEALFRVAQEALANVARHSGAYSVELRLLWAEDALTLSVRDDGRGFDVARSTGKGVGLASMRERVEALGGSLALASEPEGTTVTARVPRSLPALASAPATPEEALEARHV